MIPGIGEPLTEAECAAVFKSAAKSGPRGKADMTAALVHLMVGVIIRIEGICFATIGMMGWAGLFAKFEHRYPIHLALATFCICAILLDGNIFGLIPFGHCDGLLTAGELGEKIMASFLPWLSFGPSCACNLFAFFASKGAGDARARRRKKRLVSAALIIYFAARRRVLEQYSVIVIGVMCMVGITTTFFRDR